MYVLGAILALSLLVIVHETGHFIVARMCKIRVLRFSLGFGPAIARWRWFGTEFQVCPILFGGYVWMDGINPMDEIDPDDKYAYPNRPAWQRFLVILAGPATNIIVAMIIGVFYFTHYGANQRQVISYVEEGAPAENRLKVGDEILTVDDKQVYYLYEGWGYSPTLTEIINAHGEREQIFKVRRNGKVVSVAVKPRMVDVTDKDDKPIIDETTGKPMQRLLVGVRPGELKREPDIGLEIRTALAYPFERSVFTIQLLYEKISAGEAPPVSGPVGIGKAFKDSLQSGWQRTLELLILINIALGLFNLFPLPALDGGRLVFLTYELITRRRPNQRIETYVHMVGFFLIFTLLIAVTVGDCRNLF